ncbi:MAG TPA: hypothetical protein VF540_03150 [Segetibacter sp.]|jgi:hypothetical protein
MTLRNPPDLQANFSVSLFYQVELLKLLQRIIPALAPKVIIPALVSNDSELRRNPFVGKSFRNFLNGG